MSNSRVILSGHERGHEEFYPPRFAFLRGPVKIAILHQVRDLAPVGVLEDGIDQTPIFGIGPCRFVLAHVVIGELVTFVRRIFRLTAEDSHKMVYQALEKILYIIFRVSADVI